MPQQNGRHFADDVFKSIFLKETFECWFNECTHCPQPYSYEKQECRSQSERLRLKGNVNILIQISKKCLWLTVANGKHLFYLWYIMTSWHENIFRIMRTSSDGNIFRVTGHLCGEFTGHRWIPHTKASESELWCFIWSAPEWTIE